MKDSGATRARAGVLTVAYQMCAAPRTSRHRRTANYISSLLSLKPAVEVLAVHSVTADAPRCYS